MYTITIVIGYAILSVLLSLSKLKTGWIVWVAFVYGFLTAFYQEQITTFLNSIL